LSKLLADRLQQESNALDLEMEGMLLYELVEMLGKVGPN